MKEHRVFRIHSGGSNGKRRQAVDVVNLLGNGKRLESLLPDEDFAHTWGSSTRKNAILEGNLIQKVMHMLLHVESHRLGDAEVFCRIDVDTFFLPENVRAYVRYHDLSASVPWALGKLQTWAVRSLLPPFPDGGAGVCLSRAALARIAAKLRLELHEKNWQVNSTALQADVEHIWGGLSTFTAKHLRVCGFPVGCFDDITLGYCLAELVIPVHSKNSDPFGRFVASERPMPCISLEDKIRNISFFEKHRLGSIEYAWEVYERWGADVDRFATCEDPEYVSRPQDWTITHAFAFHGYKNLSELRMAYRSVYNESGKNSPNTKPFCKSPPLGSWRFRLVHPVT